MKLTENQMHIYAVEIPGKMNDTKINGLLFARQFFCLNLFIHYCEFEYPFN